ncbi:MAG: hypothetical protein K2L72_00680, partial [Clostridia bacterium]|nr:hypothetical protein [Clostridia bacterium]
FLSDCPAALKLDGAYLGIIDKFERYVDADDGAKILAEVLPDGEYTPVNFFIDGAFLKKPPDFCDVYLTEGDAVIYVSRYAPREQKLEVVAQTQFCGGQYTLFLNGGGVYVNAETNGCNLYPLPPSFSRAAFKEERIGNFPVLVLEGESCLAVFSESGKRVFYNPAESWSCGDRLTVTVNFNTCASCKAVCEFSYDGEKMSLEKSVTTEYVPPNENILHFAFFECVLTRGNFAKYLSESLKESADGIFGFLGEFTDVTIPYSRFYERHGDLRAAGLVYPVGHNLFNVKYFAVDIEGGKITNVYEVE